MGPTPRLVKDYKRYTLENNALERKNIKIFKKLSKMTGSKKKLPNVTKKSSKSASNEAKSIHPSKIGNEVSKLKKKNRHLRLFNKKFKKTLESGKIWEKAIREAKSVAGKMTKKRKRRKKKELKEGAINQQYQQQQSH